MGTNSFVSLPTVGVGYAATVLAATPSDLSSITTLGPLTEGGYADGQRAYVQSTGQVFTLQTISGTPNGVTTIATADDPTRQWVFDGTIDTQYIVAQWPTTTTRVYAIQQ